MYNCLILGSGRSGTSMVAGVLRNSGYYLGDDYIRPRAANPKGFFEDSIVNNINEDILTYSLRHRVSGMLTSYLPYRVRASLRLEMPKGALWLAAVHPRTHMAAPPGIDDRIKERVQRVPFCYKDPRLSYTLDIWQRWVPEGTRYVVVFRDPVVTAKSIVREVSESAHLHCIGMSMSRALRAWGYMYERVLCRERRAADYLFVHYDRIASGEATEVISRFLGVAVDASFADKRISRTECPASIADRTEVPLRSEAWAYRIYRALLEREKISIGRDNVQQPLS